MLIKTTLVYDANNLEAICLACDFLTKLEDLSFIIIIIILILCGGLSWLRVWDSVTSAPTCTYLSHYAWSRFLVLTCCLYKLCLDGWYWYGLSISVCKFSWSTTIVLWYFFKPESCAERTFEFFIESSPSILAIGSKNSS